MAYQLINLGSGTYGAYDPASQQARSFSSEAVAKQFLGTDTIDYKSAIAPTFDVSKITGANADKLVSFAPPAPTTQPVQMGVPTPTGTPDLPVPTAVDTHSAYLDTNTATLDQQRKAVEDAYKARLDTIAAQKATTQAKIDQLTANEQNTITGPVKDLSQPFQAALEATDRNKFQVEQNYQANQKLVNELDQLLTDGNSMMAKLQSEKVPGLAGLQQSPSLINAMNNVAARVGVINAVMAARNNQISVAENLIDRSVNAVNADRKDQLNYYNTLLNFFDKQRDEQGNKLIDLSKDETGFINAQIGLLESDLARSQETADYVKKLMVSPDTAQFMADAGITLNDSVATIQQKMAAQAKVVQRQDEAKANLKESFDAGIQTPYYNKGGTIIRTADGWGFSDLKEFQDMTGMSLKDAEAKGLVSTFSTDVLAAKNQVTALMNKYWDAGIRPGDDINTATAKALKSAIYLDAIRPPGGGSGGGSDVAGIGLYNSTIDEALMQGATPEEAVFAAIALADQLGSKLSAKDQGTLLQYARDHQGKVAPGSTDSGNTASGNSGVSITPQDFGHEVLPAVGKIVSTPVKVGYNLIKGGGKVLDGVAQGIVDFFK